MASSFFLSFFLLFSLSFFSLANADGNLIQRICNFSEMDIEGCKSTLMSDPNSMKADELGLLDILLNKIKALSVESIAYTEKQLNSTGGDADAQAAYSTCRTLWESMAAVMDKTIKAVAAKDLEAADEAYNEQGEGYQCTAHFVTNEFKNKKDEMYNRINRLYQISYYVNNIWTSLRNGSIKTNYKVAHGALFSPSG